MSNQGRSSPTPGSASVPLSSSPASARARSYGTSVPRADTTARLASPIPSQAFGTPPAAQSSTPKSGAWQSPDSPSLLPAGGASTAGPGVSALAAALLSSIGTSPPRLGTPPVRPASPAASAALVGASATPTNYGSFDARSRYPTTSAYEDPEIVKRHLVQPSDSSFVSDESGKRKTSDSKGKQTVESSGTGLHEGEFSSLRLQGGDITRPIYKWTEEAGSKVQRSQSFSVPRPDPEEDVFDINAIKVPGGFRRNFLRRTAGSPSGDNEGQDSEEGTSSGGQQPPLFTSSFLEFLSIYGHFAGEELEEDDEVLGPGEYFASGEDYEGESEEGSEDERAPLEDSTLLTPSLRKRRRKGRGGERESEPHGGRHRAPEGFRRHWRAVPAPCLPKRRHALQQPGAPLRRGPQLPLLRPARQHPPKGEWILWETSPAFSTASG